VRLGLNGLMVLVFVASAAVQYNDPDPTLWMLLYMAAAALCVGWACGWVSRWWFAGMAVAAAFAALAVVNTAPAGVDVWSAVWDWQMNASGSEIIRETGGLLLVAFWMAVLAQWSWAEVRVCRS
jgi:hypothetical protein